MTISVFDWKYESSPGPEVTAYTTTWNCLDGGYPVEMSIDSFSWADKIVVVDGGSTDGTRELLKQLADKNPKIEVYDIPIDLENPGKDGYQKAMALAMCATPLTIQFDIDEVCIGSGWRELIKDLPAGTDILSLPVLEPIGDLKNIRMNREHTPWKWRVLRTKPEITHGIPKQDQLMVGDKKHSKGGSDGCFLIHIVSEELYPHRISASAKKLVEVKNSGNKDEYLKTVSNLLASNTPAILHLGHVDLDRKIRHYLKSWSKWWCHLYNKDAADPKNNIYFPGVATSDVTDEMIAAKVKEIIETTPSVRIQ